MNDWVTKELKRRGLKSVQSDRMLERHDWRERAEYELKIGWEVGAAFAEILKRIAWETRNNLRRSLLVSQLRITRKKGNAHHKFVMVYSFCCNRSIDKRRDEWHFLSRSIRTSKWWICCNCALKLNFRWAWKPKACFGAAPSEFGAQLCDTKRKANLFISRLFVWRAFLLWLLSFSFSCFLFVFAFASSFRRSTVN